MLHLLIRLNFHFISDLKANSNLAQCKSVYYALIDKVLKESKISLIECKIHKRNCLLNFEYLL